jgi:hypothetical protein
MKRWFTTEQESQLERRSVRTVIGQIFQRSRRDNLVELDWRATLAFGGGNRRLRSTGPHRIGKTRGPGATARGQGLTNLVHIDEYDWRGEEREHLGHQQSANDRIA